MAGQSSRRAEPATPNWKFKAPPVLLGEERFKLTAKPLGKGGQTLPLDDVTTQFSWNDQSSELEGSIGLADEAGTLKLAQGQLINCKFAARDGQAFTDLWTLQVQAPEAGLQQKTVTVELKSALAQANKGTDNYSYRKSRSHPRGWTADQIARNVSARTYIPLGKLAKCTHKITNLVVNKAKPVDVITRAYRAERVATGRLFFIYWDGRLNIVPLTPSPNLLMFAGAIIDAKLTESLRSDFATALTVRATTRSGKRHSKKITVKVQSKAGIKQYGYVHREVTAPDAHSVTEARRYGETLLAKAIKPERTLAVTIPVYPTLRRGDAFKIDWRAQGVTQVCYVSGLSHSVAPGSATTEITASFTSPFADEFAKLMKEKRDQKARERGRASAKKAAVTGGSGAQAKRRS